MDMQHTPDAALPLIRREDYRPPDWLVPEIKLDVALGLTATRVTTTLSVRRNGTVPTIRLNGDGLIASGVVVDGGAPDDWRMDGDDLLIDLAGDAHTITVTTTINPAANTKLMGLYASGGMLCTQCEAEGFRRIAFFPDRPDVLAIWTVWMAGDKALFPVLLANGNCVAQGERPDNTHWAEWHDPWPKPCYLFAMVAGDLVANSGSFTTCSGREVALNIWVRPGDEARTHHALASLQHAMKWDEETFGREYDLDLFNVVAVSDFNMGAMENKGLNVFNTRYVLADAETATDADYDGVESVIGHEYFHNWSGNRVTCRDWFQLSLKEGFTVLRDQLFSADMGSAPVKRIEDVRLLRSVQFPEDSGPLAHPIRPDSFHEISNFYTATIYNKGAEVIRMMRTMAGESRFRAGTDLYFARHDGEAATCEDFIAAIEAGAGLDLKQFRRWYQQAGTPQVTARLEHDGGTATLHLAQTVPPTPGQPDKSPMPIPLKIALFDPATAQHSGERLIVLEEARASFTFPGHASRPILSINRDFSAPIQLETDQTSADLSFLAAHDDDAFARFEAMQSLMLRHIVGGVSGGLDRQASEAAICAAMRSILADQHLDDLMRGELMVLPSQAYLAEQFAVADPGAILREREALKAALGRALAGELAALHDRASAVPFSLDAAAKGARMVKSQALVLLAAAVPDAAAQRAAAQCRAADNMTDRLSALATLCGLDTPERETQLAAFHARFAGDPLVIDKWFSLQAASLHPRVLAQARSLAGHADFTLANPNRVRALYMALMGNPLAFHDPSGGGYRFVADLILELDPLNPQTAARFVAPFGRWRRTEPGRAALMKAELERIAAAPGLSRDTHEQVTKSLG